MATESTGATTPHLDENFYRTLLDNLADGVYFVDTERRINYWNSGAERITGHAAEGVVGRTCFDNILNHVDAQGRQLCADGCPLLATMQDGCTRDAQVWLRHREGWRRPVRVRTAAIRNAEGSVVGGVEVFDDNTAIVDVRRELEDARGDALHDELTGLPNRRYLDLILTARLEDRRQGQSLALLFADVDKLKAVNDRDGHLGGDALLRGVSATLRGAVRPGDFLARWGGDEFAVLAQGLDQASAKALADRLRRLVAAMRSPNAGRISMSVGVAVAAADDDATTIIERADGALYEAKRGGRDRVGVAPRQDPLADVRPDAPGCFRSDAAPDPRGGGPGRPNR